MANRTSRIGPAGFQPVTGRSAESLKKRHERNGGLPGFPRSRKPPLVRMIERLLPFAQLFIELQPQPGVVFDNIAHLLHTLQVHFQLLRREIETKVVTRFDQKFL